MAEKILDRHTFKSIGRTFPLDPGQNEVVVQCRGSPSESSVISVVLLRRDEIASVPGPLVGWPYARIQFGSGGCIAEFECDIINGLAFSIPASAIRIQVFNPSDSPGQMDLGAFVSYLPLARSSRLKRSFPIGPIAALASTGLIAIPSFAGTVNFERDQGQSFRIDFFDHSGNLRYSSAAAANQDIGPVEISAGVAFVSVFNSGFKAWNVGSVVFGLEI